MHAGNPMRELQSYGGSMVIEKMVYFVVATE